jgi:hypothetical protein
MTSCPEIHIDGVEDAKESESPGDAIYDGVLSSREELVDNGSKQE